MDKILTAAREVSAQLGINLEEHRPINNFQKLPAYEKEPLIAEAIDEGLGLCMMTRVTCAATGLATPILDEIREMSGEQEAVFIATVKSVTHAYAVERGQHIAPASVLDCSTVVAIDEAGRLLLWETIGA